MTNATATVSRHVISSSRNSAPATTLTGGAR